MTPKRIKPVKAWEAWAIVDADTYRLLRRQIYETRGDAKADFGFLSLHGPYKLIPVRIIPHRKRKAKR